MIPPTSDTNRQQEAQADRNFWVGPLLAGCCFSLGYGITHRVVTLQTNPSPQPARASFAGLQFPGESLASLRLKQQQAIWLWM